MAWHGEVIEGGEGIDVRTGERGGRVQVSLSFRGRPFTDPGSVSELFAVRTSDGGRSTPALEVSQASLEVERSDGAGWSDLVVRTVLDGATLGCTLRLRRYDAAPVLRQQLSLRNLAAVPIRITGVDTVCYTLSLGAEGVLRGFRSAWGLEFEPFQLPLSESPVVETLFGRSSNGAHPFVFFGPSGDSEGLVLAPMWSGNWTCRAERVAADLTRASGGLADEGFWYELAPDEVFEAPDVAISVEGWPAKATGASALAEVGRRHWYPPRPGGKPLPTEWNHWFPYTDSDISEEVFVENVDAAAVLGFELCTLDAGWFGPSDRSSEWTDWRGDWDLVNRERFPSGLSALARRCRDRGMDFGIWCEIEGLGSKATLGARRDRLEARRGGDALGYVCFGNPEARVWALAVIDSLVSQTSCRWVKLDFNVDPGLGCDREDHGHSGGSGLYEHVRNYYRFLDDLRSAHPAVVLENCSSGGLRIDLGMLSHLHVTYLSDLDWLDHSLQVLWGVGAMAAPSACLKFSNSEWGGSHASRALELRQDYDPRDPGVSPGESDTYFRSAMLHDFAVSLRLPDLPERVAKRLRAHVYVYRSLVREFVESGRFLRLTDQPLRDGGERLPAFQMSLESEDRHLLFVFRLDGEAAVTAVHPAGLSPGVQYRVTSPFPEEFEEARREGKELMEAGIDASALPRRHSRCLLIEPYPVEAAGGWTLEGSR